jgi:monoamine oxidase
VFRGRPEVLLDVDNDLLAVSDLRAEPSRWPLALTEEEKGVAPSRLLAHYLTPVAQQIGTVDKVLDPDFLQYDAMSLLEFLERAGASPAAIQMIGHTANYNSLETVSALSALRDATRALFNAGGQALNLKNGNESLTTAFAEKLAPLIHYETALRRVENSNAGITLHFETPDGNKTWEAHNIILTIPFTALRRITFEPELPAERRTIIDQLPYTQVAQTYLQTAQRFWADDDNVLAVYSDGPLERLFNASSRMRSDRGLLVNWMNGVGAMAVRDMDGEEQAEFAVRELERIWPDSRKLVETTYTNDWGKSYAEGAYAHYAPGQMARFAADIPTPIGRMHFAGEHTELVAPGMEGALTSGQRAASEVIDRLDPV